MAHECPECGLICHCGGDIDDIVMRNTREELRCTCCPVDGIDDDIDMRSIDDDDGDDGDLNTPGCSPWPSRAEREPRPPQDPPFDAPSVLVIGGSCPKCNGSGASSDDTGDEVKRCPACYGSGDAFNG